MDGFSLLFIAFILMFNVFMSSAILASPFWLAWGVFCLARRGRQAEGICVIGFGLLFVLSVEAYFHILSFLLISNSPPAAPSWTSRRNEFLQLAAFFACGALAGEVYYRVYWLGSLVFRGMRWAARALHRVPERALRQT